MAQLARDEEEIEKENLFADVCNVRILLLKAI